MSRVKFDGFNNGCSGEVMFGEPPYINRIAHFQLEGRKLESSDAGQVEPDAIRVVPVDDYLGSTYRDEVFAFDEDTAQRQESIGDDLVPKGNIFALSEGDIVELNDACQGCSSSQEGCPVLSLAIERSLNK